MSIVRTVVRNPVFANLLMITIIVLGTLSFVALPRELMSEISLNWAFIITPYPGVPPQEIERLITVPIEEEIQDVKGIESITSQASEGSSFISVKFKQMDDEEFRSRFQDLRTEVDKVDLPDDVLDTETVNFTTTEMQPLITAHLHGRIPEKRLIEMAKQLRDELLNITGIGKVELQGTRDREVWVEADPVKLDGFGLSPARVQAAIAAQGINIPAGRLTAGRHEVLVRTIGEFHDATDIQRVIVHALPTGEAIKVADVARVTETFEEERTRSRVGGEPVVSFSITKKLNASSIAVTDEVKRTCKDFADRRGEGLGVSYTLDTSEMIEDILGKLTRNAWAGFAIVLVVLLLVLGLRNAMLAAMGIPISFLACFIFLHRTGGSFNGNSLFGLVLVLGVIVDDAIIIVENCYRHRQSGKPWSQAAIDGTREVAAPVLSATATTVAVFLPLMLMPGIMGKFMRVVPMTFSLALLASVIEAFVILPAHFAEWPGKTLRSEKERRWLVELINMYESALRFVVRRRYLFLLLPPLLLVGAAAIVPLVGVDMFAGEEIGIFQVRMRMPTGTSLKTTAKVIEEFEDAAAALPGNEVRAVHATAGLLMTDTDWYFRSDVGQLWVDLVPSYDRKRNEDAVMSDLRERVKRIAGPISIELAKINQGPPVGKAVEVKVKGRYLDRLEKVAEEIKILLSGMDGVLDIDDDYREGTREMRLQVDPSRAAMQGLSVGQVGLAVRNAVHGADAGRLFDGDEEIDIVVRVDQRFLDRPEALLRLPLLTPMGTTVPLGQVASFTLAPGLADIRRYKQQRAITVSANVDEAKTSSVTVSQALQKKLGDIGKRYPGVTFDFSGEFKEFSETWASLLQLFLFGILLVYIILGTQFRSYIQPLVILLTVPFAFVGAALGLLISGNPFSIATLYGMVALAGVAVNDAIVLISFINNKKAEGLDPIEAVIEGARLRLRPIMLTSITTISGLIPMAVGLGGMSLTWAPLANTIVWGLGVGTLLTVFLIPPAYVILVEDIGGRFRRRAAPQDHGSDAKPA